MERIKKIFSVIGLFLWYLFLEIILLLCEIIKGVFSGNIVLIIILIYCATKMYKFYYHSRLLFWIIVGIVAFIFVSFDIWMIRKGDFDEEEEADANSEQGYSRGSNEQGTNRQNAGNGYSGGYHYERNYSNGGVTKRAKNPFFEGMTFEEAKKEYRRLLKKYHPDNVGGDAKKTQEIVAAYDDYCRINKKGSACK